MDFCERSEYSNCAGGKNSWQSCVVRGVNDRLPGIWNTPGLERSKRIVMRDTMDFYYCMRRIRIENKKIVIFSNCDT